MRQVVYDAGVLVAADRNDRSVWADHRVRLESGIVPAVPAPVIAQVSRSPAQAQLRRLLRGCEVVSLTEQGAHAAGQLLGRAGSADVVDAVVAQTAAGLRAGVVTGDRAAARSRSISTRSGAPLAITGAPWLRLRLRLLPALVPGPRAPRRGAW